jgi:CheY-like chemotaxis protein
MDSTIHLLLADDDKDDCLFFKEILEELPLKVELTTLNDGEQLVQHLEKLTGKLPSLLFLDLNMPKKNGFECLEEIKKNSKFKQLPVVIYSTSFDPITVNLLYSKGANYYIQKPGEFSKLKKVIHQAILLTANTGASQPERDQFIIQP